MSHQFGFISLIGKPNVGKSTLINAMVGQKISIISRKPQTTRHRILGIKTTTDYQMVFVDCPGIHHDERKTLNRVINRTAINSIADVDLVIFMIDHSGWSDYVESLARMVQQRAKHMILVINKMDRLQRHHDLLPIMQQAQKVADFVEVVPISASKGKGITHLTETILKHLPEGEPGFPDDQISDRSDRFLASEMIREELYNHLGQELPYESAVEINQYETREDGMLNVVATIWVQKPGQKGIIIGKGGAQLKRIGQRARQQMEHELQQKVFLDLWVKVQTGWADNGKLLRSLGYQED